MTSANPQAMPNPSQASTRIKFCIERCGAQTIERLKQLPSIGGRVASFWENDWGSETCPECFARITAARDADLAKKAIQENWNRLAAMLGGPQPVDELTLEKAQEKFTLEKAVALDIARRFDPGQENLFFYGPTGTGKSHLAVGIAISQCKDGRSVAYYTPASLNREFRRRLDPDKEQAFLRYLWSVEVLVLDELGVGKATEYAMEKLQEIIDGRVKNYRKGLIITSNLDFNALAEMCKDRIPDRLNGMCRRVKMEGHSYRGLQE